MIYGMDPKLNQELCEKFLNAYPQYRESVGEIPSLLNKLAESYANPDKTFWYGNTEYKGFQEFLDKIHPKDDLENIRLLFTENFRFAIESHEAQAAHLRKIAKFMPIGAEDDIHLVHLFKALLQWMFGQPEEKVPDTPDQWNFCFEYMKIFQEQNQNSTIVNSALERMQEIREQMGYQNKKKDVSLVTAYADCLAELGELASAFRNPAFEFLSMDKPAFTSDLSKMFKKLEYSTDWSQIQQIAQGYLKHQNSLRKAEKQKSVFRFDMEVQEMHLAWIKESKKALDCYETFLKICPLLPRHPSVSRAEFEGLPYQLP